MGPTRDSNPPRTLEEFSWRSIVEVGSRRTWWSVEDLVESAKLFWWTTADLLIAQVYGGFDVLGWALVCHLNFC